MIIIQLDSCDTWRGFVLASALAGNNLGTPDMVAAVYMTRVWFVYLIYF